MQKLQKENKKSREDIVEQEQEQEKRRNEQQYKNKKEIKNWNKGIFETNKQVVNKSSCKSPFTSILHFN